MNKKRVFLVLGIILIIIVIVLFLLITNDKISFGKTEKPEKILYYKLDDKNIYLYDFTTFKITYNDKTRELNKWLAIDKDFMDLLIVDLEKDFKPIVYQDAKKYVCQDNVFIVCNSNNKDIHIGKNIDYDEGMCK